MLGGGGRKIRKGTELMLISKIMMLGRFSTRQIADQNAEPSYKKNKQPKNPFSARETI